MAFTKKTWKDGADGGTPITADELNRIEAGIAEKAAKGDKGDKGDDGKPGKDGAPSLAEWNALVARVDALEG